MVVQRLCSLAADDKPDVVFLFNWGHRTRDGNKVFFEVSWPRARGPMFAATGRPTAHQQSRCLRGLKLVPLAAGYGAQAYLMKRSAIDKVLKYVQPGKGEVWTSDGAMQHAGTRGEAMLAHFMACFDDEPEKWET